MVDEWNFVRLLASQKHKESYRINQNDSAEELLSAASKITGIRLVPVGADDPLLFGSEAILDPDAQTIWYNSEVDIQLARYYQAHEFAHYWIDCCRSVCNITDLDIEIEDEPTSLGEKQVEGYHPLEHRELLANVFAREFLLPSDKLREWFIEENINADSIASRAGLPVSIVYSQLSYALLAPPSVEVSPKTTDNKKQDINPLDPDQAKAAFVEHGPLLIQAGPGTGKTKTLIGRVIFLVETKHVDPESILVLTFSNKAAEELRNRVAKVLPNAAPHIWMGTFHSFSLELLRKYGSDINLTSAQKVISPVDALLLLETHLPELQLQYYLNLYEPAFPLRDILQAISRAKDELATPDDYIAFSQQMREKSATVEEIEDAEKSLEVGRVYRKYQELLNNNGLLDFGDLIFKAVKLLQECPNVKNEVQSIYQHILVDEYQDVNRACALLLKQLSGNGKGLWVVGDVRQSIYRFRGAAPQNMQLFKDDFIGADVHILGSNYRTLSKPLSVFSSLAPQMKASNDTEFNSWKVKRLESDGQIFMRVADDLASEGLGISLEIKRFNAEGIPYREQAILCRSHTNLARIATILERENIPILYLGDLFERTEIRDLLALISLACEGDGQGLVRVATFLEYDIPLADVQALLKLSQEQNIFFPKALSIANSSSAISPKGKKGIALLEKHIGDISFGTSAWTFLVNFLFNRSTFLKIFLQSPNFNDQIKRLAIFQFLNFVHDQKPPQSNSRDPKRQLLDYIRRLEIFGEEKQLRQVPDIALSLNAVRLMTVHASKGLEFQVVYLPMLGQGYFPARKQAKACPLPYGLISSLDDDQHIEEEECLFFVALSRAQDILCLSRSRQYGERTSNPSNLLSMVSNVLPTSPDGEPVWKSKGVNLPSVNHDNLISDESNDYKVEDLDLYIKCPKRYYYERVLNLIGRDDESAYLKLHHCLSAVLQWAKEKTNNTTIVEQDLLAKLDGIWTDQGPIGHAFETIYRKNAETMLSTAFRNNLITGRYECPQESVIELANGKIKFTPDYVESLADGKRAIRRMRTGKVSSSEKDKDIYFLYHEMVRNDPSFSHEIEVFSLTSGQTENIKLTEKTAATRRAHYEKAIAGILKGQYPPIVNDRDCPRCPHYFICTSSSDTCD